MPDTCHLSSDARALLSLLVAEWLKGTDLGLAILDDVPLPVAVDAVLALRDQGVVRFVTTGDLSADRFGFAVEVLPETFPALARIASGGRMVH